MGWIWLLLALVPVAIVAGGIVLCLPYWRSPEKRWQYRVLRVYQRAKRQIDCEQAASQRLSKNYRDESQALSRKAFERFLASISVNELEAYPGIGPATISRLKAASFSNLARLQNARIRVRGLGQKRLADVDSAVQQLTRQAETRFQASACPESQRLRTQLQKLEARYTELECRAQGRVKGATEVLRQLEPAVAIARQVTFWKYFWKDTSLVVPAELLHRSLPDPLAAAAAAERQVMKAFQARQAAGGPRSENKSKAVVPVADASPGPAEVPAARPAANPEPSTRSTLIPDGIVAESPEPFRWADRLSSSSRSAPAPVSSRSPTPRTATNHVPEWLEATIEFAFAVARTDGSISRKETAFIDGEMKRHYQQDAALYNRVKAWCAHYATGAIDIGGCLEHIKECFTPEQRENLLEFACQLARASGPMNQREIRLLERASREWGVPWKRPAAALVAYPQPTKPAPEPTAAVPLCSPALEPRALLEIEPAAQLTAELIRRQYNLLSSRLAPEKMESLGPEFVAMAQSKRQALRTAAETLIQPLCEPLDLPVRPPEPAEVRHNPDLDAMFGV